MRILCLIVVIFTLIMLSTSIGRKRFSRSSRILAHRAAEVTLLSGLRDIKVATSPPVVVNAFVDKEILSALQMRNKGKKCRLLISSKAQEEWSLAYLRRLIEIKFPDLTDQPYKLRYKTPSAHDSELKRFSDDEDLKRIFKVFSTSSSPLHLFIQINPGVFPSSTPLLVDPLESSTYTLVSFYAFSNITDPEELSQVLRSLWEPFKALGRIYIAEEGVNAQMAVPSNSFADFVKATQTLALFSSSRFNVDHEMSTADFHSQQVFKNLHIRVREQIVADGLVGEGLDWSRSGTELSPLDWHASLDNPNAVILDCRNTYETDVGRFKGAIPLNTTFFRESWTALEEVLKDVPPTTPVLTYCTGGIRCVKINAYLEQKMGFNNTYRLKGGIISYAKTLESQASELKGKSGEIATPIVITPHLPMPYDSQFQRDVKDSKFLGINYVFDDRMGARVTADVFAKCESCGQSCDAFTNCLNFDCNVSRNVFLLCIVRYSLV
ncbi:hypothetical protein EON65_09520 [archaeon]|nr:MAG: hypothetical protein EON65_09520 [archaeon]